MNFGSGLNLHFLLQFVPGGMKSILGVIVFYFDFEN